VTPALSEAIAAVVAALSAAGGCWQMRGEQDSDQPFVDALYTDMRWEELAPVPWPNAAKIAFLQEQSRLQADHYRKNYPGAALCVVERDGEPVGRFYLYVSAGEFRLMDIALLPAWRGQGHGARMIVALMQVAHRQCRDITLHVEPNNPALRFYARLGFTLREDKGVYHFLGWSPAQLNTAS
jgi:ribosomal protein S18 acetylase RimI-like enzyme